MGISKILLLLGVGAASVVIVTPVLAAPGLSGGRAVDGDTIELRNNKDVRVIGIDTPEEGQCGYGPAKNATQRFINQGFVLKRVDGDTTDRYGRLLRSVTRNDGKDLGVYLINRGLAVARYDSRDGYGYHPQERKYHRLDKLQGRNVCGFNPTAGTSGGSGGSRFANCTEAINAGKAPLYRGQPAYSPDLDADGDGVACEV